MHTRAHTHTCTHTYSYSYYLKVFVPTVADFLSINNLDSYLDIAVSVQQLARETMPNAELWLGDTSSSFRTPKKWLYGSYVTCFM